MFYVVFNIFGVGCTNMSSSIHDGLESFWCPLDMFLILLRLTGSYFFGLDMCWQMC